MMLLATCLASLTISVRAQLEDDAGTVTTDTGRAGGATGLGKDEVTEPAGEPKGTNVTAPKRLPKQPSIPPTRIGRTHGVLPLGKNPLGAPLKNRLSMPAACVHA